MKKTKIKPDAADDEADAARLDGETPEAAPPVNGEDNGLQTLNGDAHESTNHANPPEAKPETPPPADDSRDELTERIRRLEESLAQLLEMKDRQTRDAATPVPIVLVARIVPPPSPITTAPSSDSAHAFLFNVGKQMFAPPVASIAQPTFPAPESPFAAGLRWTGLLFDAYAEVRVIFRMYVDPRYQMSWLSRLLPIVLGLLLLFSKYWVPGTSLEYVGWLIDKAVELPLAFLFFKVLSHEARRYRQTSPDLPYAMRLPPDR